MFVNVMPHEKKRKKGVFCFVSTVQRDLFIFVTVVTRYCARHESGSRSLCGRQSQQSASSLSHPFLERSPFFLPFLLKQHL